MIYFKCLNSAFHFNYISSMNHKRVKNSNIKWKDNFAKRQSMMHSDGGWEAFSCGQRYCWASGYTSCLAFWARCKNRISRSLHVLYWACLSCRPIRSWPLATFDLLRQYRMSLRGSLRHLTRYMHYFWSRWFPILFYYEISICIFG